MRWWNTWRTSRPSGGERRSRKVMPVCERPAEGARSRGTWRMSYTRGGSISYAKKRKSLTYRALRSGYRDPPCAKRSPAATRSTNASTPSPRWWRTCCAASARPKCSARWTGPPSAGCPPRTSATTSDSGTATRCGGCGCARPTGARSGSMCWCSSNSSPPPMRPWPCAYWSTRRCCTGNCCVAAWSKSESCRRCCRWCCTTAMPSGARQGTCAS